MGVKTVRYDKNAMPVAITPAATRSFRWRS